MREIIVLGKFIEGLISIDLNSNPNIVIEAAPGQGKTNLMESIVEQVLTNDKDAKAYVLSKYDGDFIYNNINITSRALDKNQYIHVLSGIKEIIKERNKLENKEELHRVIVIIDDNCLDKIIQHSDDLREILFYILAEGRYVNVSVLMGVVPTDELKETLIMHCFKTILEGRLDYKNNELNIGEFYLNRNKEVKILTEKSSSIRESLKGAMTNCIEKE